MRDQPSADQADLPPFFRGVTPFAFIPIAALIMSAEALGLYSDVLYHSSKAASSAGLALQLLSECNFVRTGVALLGVLITVLLVRSVGGYLVRAVYWIDREK